MSKEKILHELVLLYDKSTASNLKPTTITQEPLVGATINDLPSFEQRCSIIAWHIAYLEYAKINPDKTYQTFISECVGTLEGLALYRNAFESAQNILDKELTISKILTFQQSFKVP